MLEFIIERLGLSNFPYIKVNFKFLSCYHEFGTPSQLLHHLPKTVDCEPTRTLSPSGVLRIRSPT